MAVAPKAKKRSPAQVAAGRAFAAAGRAAQASARAAVIAKTGKPPPVSAARHAAGQKAARASQAAAKAKKAGKTVPRAAVMPTELVVPGTRTWPLGCNDEVPTCAAVAVACHMQAATGVSMTDAEILKLHQLAGGDNGARIADVLEVIRTSWFGFGNGRVKLLHFFPTDEQCLIAGLVVGVRLPHAGHAVLSAPGGMISWGQYMPWDGEPEEAWALEWGP
jgi:hypothetical protein